MDHLDRITDLLAGLFRCGSCTALLNEDLTFLFLPLAVLLCESRNRIDKEHRSHGTNVSELRVIEHK